MMTTKTALPGTKIGKDTGALLLFCQCCRKHPQILGAVLDGKLTIEKRVHGERHYVVVGTEVFEQWQEGTILRCMCCAPPVGIVLGIFLDDEYVILRSQRHQRLHFITMAKPWLEMLLARY